MNITKKAALIVVGVGLTVNGYSQSFLTNGLTAYYPFNGSADDATNYGRKPIEQSVSYVEDRFGNKATAIQLNGTTDFVKYPFSGLPSGTNSKTLSLWVSVDPQMHDVGDAHIIGFGGAESGGMFGFFIDPAGYIKFHGYFADLQVLKVDATPTSWIHLVATYSGSVLTVWANGEQLNSAPMSLNTLTDSLQIGRWVANSSNSYFRGSVDDVRIYNRELSPSEVQQLYRYDSSRLNNGLVAYYPFNGNANDASGNGADGTVTGATLTTDRLGQTNQAYFFGGKAAYITVPFGSTLFSNDFTTSVWFKADDISNGWPTILHEENQSFVLQIPGNACSCDRPGNLISYSHNLGSGGGVFNWYLARRQDTPLGKYNQVIITKSGTNVTMYLNAQVAATGIVSNPNIHSGNTLWIGRAPTEDAPGAYVFHGVLDDIRIYDRVLSADEVTMLYDYESGPRVNLIKAVKPSFSSLSIGTAYQLQVSADMATWTNYGSPFTATTNSMVFPQYWDVDNWAKLFFRLESKPSSP